MAYRIDPDFDSDFDPDEKNSQHGAGGQAWERPIVFRSLRSGFRFSDVAGSRDLRYNAEAYKEWRTPWKALLPTQKDGDDHKPMSSQY